MTGNKKIKQFKFFYLCAKFRAFTDVMLDGDEKEWKIFLSRHEEFFNDPKNSYLKRSSLMELMNNKSVSPKMFANFMVLNNMGSTFCDDVRLDENDKVVYCVDNNLFTLGSRYNRKI
jgi:hypothetical protein